MFKQIWQSLGQSKKRVLFTLVLIALAVVGGVTDSFSKVVHASLQQAFVDYFHKLTPFAVSLLVAAIMYNIASIFYKPICAGVEKVLEKSGVPQRGQDLSLKLTKFLYWAVTVFLILSLTESELLGRFVIGFGVFGAALTLALQGAANDFICGVLLQVTRKISVGDQIKIEGIEVEGKVTSVSYLSTVVETEAEMIHVPNREVWSRAIKVAKLHSSLIIPAGYLLDSPTAPKKSV